jgi:hypothetical protein
MGLDTVELVMEVEEEFGITIPDEDAEKISTVGQLYAYVLERLSFFATTPCLSGALFYRLRRVLIRLHHVDRSGVRPAARIDELVGLADRRRVWAEFRRVTALDIPRLRRPPWLVRGITVALAFCFVVLLVGLCSLVPQPGPADPGYSVMAICAAVCTVPLGMLFCFATLPFARECAPNCVTVRDLIRETLRINYGEAAIRGKRWDPPEIWERLRTLIADQAGVERETITAKTDIVRDLM